MASLDDIRDVSSARLLFPYLQQRVYLDTASAGLSWQGLGAASAAFYEPVKSRGYDAADEWRAQGLRVRQRLAAWLGVAADDITFLSNTTEALNLIAHSLRFQPGDRIVVPADEFPSVIRVWNIAEQRGAQVVRVPIPNEAHRQIALEHAIDERTRVVAVSQTNSSTGTTLNLDTLGQHCRNNNALLVVDGIQALGAVHTHLKHVDIYASSFFKWMLCGFGVAMLAVSQRARHAIQPAYQGYANMADPQQLQYAHINYPALYGLDATLDLFEAIGFEAVYRHVSRLGDSLAEAANRQGLQPITPRNQVAGIQVFRARDGEACRVWLAQRGISVAARGAGVRVSPHFYNTVEEVEQCAALLAEAIAQC